MRWLVCGVLLLAMLELRHCLPQVMYYVQPDGTLVPVYESLPGVINTNSQWNNVGNNLRTDASQHTNYGTIYGNNDQQASSSFLKEQN
ncbi:hypothetical protein B5X24_HaOG212572 [Helicoverpa armigera]|uniref:Secreted protein n=1 Tax=Helicoverpa armigera TaxID=29058 RepID=A0A2W1BD58_HELAM|nr:hypothetical protein B5X24_HaOG212572 [Helicoverpa armigera]